MKPHPLRNRLFVFLPTLVFGMSLAQCSCSDVIGSMFVSEQQESQLGTEFDTQLRASPDYPLYQATSSEKQLFSGYVDDVFRSVVDKIPADQKPSYGFKLTIIDQDIVNAFAVPGGYVYVYTGLIRTASNESELAGVLGHEIAHVTMHHYRDAMVKETGLSILLDALTGNDPSQLTKAVASTFGSLATLKLSRENEAEADLMGTRYLGFTGRNPLGISTLFTNQAFQSTGTDWLSTHPASDTRVKDVANQVSKEATQNNWCLSDSCKFIPRFQSFQSKM